MHDRIRQFGPHAGSLSAAFLTGYRTQPFPSRSDDHVSYDISATNHAHASTPLSRLGCLALRYRPPLLARYGGRTGVRPLGRAPVTALTGSSWLPRCATVRRLSAGCGHCEWLNRTHSFICCVILPRWSHRRHWSLSAPGELDIHSLFPTGPYPQLPDRPPIAPNRGSVQLARMGRAVLNQKHNRSYHPAYEVEEVALAS